jgi:uncharacterized membrane protein YvlD (DUF360 family)
MRYSGIRENFKIAVIACTGTMIRVLVRYVIRSFVLIYPIPTSGIGFGLFVIVFGLYRDDTVFFFKNIDFINNGEV